MRLPVNMNRRLTDLIVAATLTLLACGGEGDDVVVPPSPTTMAFASPSGDGQSGAPGSILDSPFRVIVTQSGAPVAGQTVTWSLVTGGGSLSSTSTTTDAAGVAVSRLTLGSTTGAIQVQAASFGVAGSPVFSASAVVPGQFATVQVANNLFEPSQVTIAPGGTVLFQWLSSARDHNLVPIAPATIPNAPIVRSGPFGVEQIFQVPGSYGFFCSVHATATTGSMRGQVIVQ